MNTKEKHDEKTLVKCKEPSHNVKGCYCNKSKDSNDLQIIVNPSYSQYIFSPIKDI